MPKGTSQAEATLNSEKIKPVALAIIKLCLTVGQLVSQAGRQAGKAVSQKIPLNNFFFF